MSNTLWGGSQADKLYLQSGQFTSTVKTSQYIGGVDSSITGLSWDGTNTPWIGTTAYKLYLQSGQFSSTLKTSQAVGVDNTLRGISWDRTNTPWAGRQYNKLYLQSGQFTSTLKTSQAVGTVDNAPQSISFDSTNTPWIGNESDKLYLTSGQFSSTLKTSQFTISTVPSGVTWDGTNTPWASNASNDKLMLQSGQFSSTIKTSQYVGGTDTIPAGIETDDIDSRLPPPEILESASSIISLNQTVSLSSIFTQSLSNNIVLTQTVVKTFEESISSVISLNQSLSQLVVFNKVLSDTIPLVQQVASSLELVSSAAHNISLSQSASYDLVPPPLYDANPKLNRFIRRTLYSLKRQYGNRIDVYKLKDAETNYQTGVKTVIKSVTVVRKCIVLPVKIAREVVQTITQISANKMFVYGGSYDAGTRMFIIDTRDMPRNYEFTNDDWIVYHGRRYDIKSIEEFEHHTAWSIIGREIKGVRPEQVFFAHITEQLALEHTVV